MRERIDVELSKKFQEGILLPEAQRDYEEVFEELIILNKAYALGLKKIGYLCPEDCKTIVEALDYVYDTLQYEDLSGNCEDLYFNVEQAMVKKIGVEVGGRLHTGRSRNDIYSCMTRMEVRKTSWEIMDRVIELQESLVNEAARNTRTVITGHTHNQPGQPITLGHYYSALAYALCRDFDRIKHAYNNTNRSPYGAAASFGGTFDIDEDYLCELAGFDSTIENSLDAIASKDYAIEMEMAYTLLMNNISRFASDMYFWATFENGILDLGGEVAICSSIMPQKKNPVCFEYAKAKGGHTMGGLTSILSVLKNAPYTNNEDIFEATVMYEDALDQTIQGIDIFIEAIKYSSIKKEKAEEAARTNYSTITGMADHLVQAYDFSFEHAHAILGSIVGEVTDNGMSIDDIDHDMVERVTKEITGREINITDKEIKEALDPWENICRKKTKGSPNEERVKTMIEDLNQKIASEKAWVVEKKLQVKNAADKLMAECKAL